MDEADRHCIKEACQRADDTQHQADELRVELERWHTATDAAQERIDRLADRAADLERPHDGWPVKRAG
jgi:predicted nuclease with TOPRIM domain